MMSPEEQALKRAQRRLVKAAGGQEAAAGLTRVGQSRLSAYGSINNPNEHMPVDVADDLEDQTVGAAGWPHVTRELARRRGFALLPLPKAQKPDDVSWHDFIARLAKESGDLISKIAPAAVGGVSAEEVVELDLEREADELVQVAVDLAAAIRAARMDTS